VEEIKTLFAQRFNAGTPGTIRPALAEKYDAR
jgi:hypothetical protein